MVQINAEMTPKEFLDSFVPEMIRSRFSGVKFGSLKDAIQIHVPEAGHWHARVEDGTPLFRSGQASDAFVTVVVSDDVIRKAIERAAAEAGDLDDLDLSEPLKTASEHITQELIDNMRAQVQGTLRLAVITGAGSEESIFIGFGGINTASPTCTLSTTESDLLDIAEKGQTPQEAFMAGKVRLDGDMTILMALMAHAVPLLDSGMSFVRKYSKKK